MLRNLRFRRRPHYGAYFCAAISALLLLLSVSLLYSRLSLSHPHNNHLHRNSKPLRDVDSDTLLLDFSDDDISDTGNGSEDKIDELDIIEEQQQQQQEEVDDDDYQSDPIKVLNSGYYFDRVSGVIRRAFNKRSLDEWDGENAGLMVGLRVEEDKSKAAFGSDDVPVDEEMRMKASQVMGIENLLLLRIGKRDSPLREGWGDWFDKKSLFLKRDRMFKSNLEVLNPLNNPILQDRDGIGLTGLTRGDRIMQKWWLNEFKRVPFLCKKPLGITEGARSSKLQQNGNEVVVWENGSEGGGTKTSEDNRELRGQIKRAERSALNENAGNKDIVAGSRKLRDTYESVVHGSVGSAYVKNSGKPVRERGVENAYQLDQLSDLKDSDSKISSWSEFWSHIYADGKRWGFYPGLHPHLTFSGFMDAFFRKGKCDMRVFMVWNSPPWMFGVRHQRGLESLFSHHPDACVVMFSETIELDFFKDSFVNDG